MQHSKTVTLAALAGIALTVGLANPAAAQKPEPPTIDPATLRSPTAVVDYLVDMDAKVHWYFGQAQQAKLDAAAAARAAATRPRGGGGGGGGTTVGECTGFSIPSYIIARESGGNPNAVNSSSGAYGCAQVMPMHWNGGACSDLNRYTIDGQRECVNRLSDGGTNLSPWSQTR